MKRDLEAEKQYTLTHPWIAFLWVPLLLALPTFALSWWSYASDMSRLGAILWAGVNAGVVGLLVAGGAVVARLAKRAPKSDESNAES